MTADLNQIATATLGRFLGSGFMAPTIQAFVRGQRVHGPALTVRMPGIDDAALIEALSIARPGEVLVIDRCGDLRHSCFGEIAGQAAQERGIAGVVIDGFVADQSALIELGLPIWCRGRSPMTTRNKRLSGEVGGLISCGGATVAKGDIILADESGVVVLDPAEVDKLVEKALRIQVQDRDILQRLKQGETLREITLSLRG
ncbi:RraA family protein [Paracoccus sp. MBLB3053]|uniref:Putative 4-hydroxy-4-methyl-2-oxoglutarate aldolase n=1 Tax=Paracoccus aurantius TaxID=3073814 RepID=A0ABU2HWN0_9RHOB|nr:RraA family protein [Paracoccus sp. MBLB3053]MDS9469014.1 RraA family protein [Paracoccus sp. MBLB3053]